MFIGLKHNHASLACIILTQRILLHWHIRWQYPIQNQSISEICSMKLWANAKISFYSSSKGSLQYNYTQGFKFISMPNISPFEAIKNKLFAKSSLMYLYDYGIGHWRRIIGEFFIFETTRVVDASSEHLRLVSIRWSQWAGPTVLSWHLKFK